MEPGTSSCIEGPYTMTIFHDRGLLLISIDVAHESRRDAGSQLLKMLNQFRVPATWALRDPAASPLTERLQTSIVNHEVALLGTADWAGEAVGRTQFAQELHRRMEAAGQQQMKVTTLSLAGCSPNEHLDLLVKNKLSVLRLAESEQAVASASVTPRSLRYGVWQSKPNCDVPGKVSWWKPPTQLLTRHVHSAATRKAIAHVRLDVETTEQSDVWRRSVQAMLTQADKLRDAGQLEVRQLQYIADVFGRQRSSTRTAQSILKRAA